MAELDWGALAASIDGSIVLPHTPGYDDARRPAIANFHGVRPQAVVRCQTASDVAETLGFAARVELPLAVRSGGHCFAGRSSTTGDRARHDTNGLGHGVG
jgi:FAD/FMN-containing dehydrogenase